jgi:hypothetical protein
MDKVVEVMPLHQDCLKCGSGLESAVIEKDTGSSDFEQFFYVVERCLNPGCREQREVAHGIAYIPGYGVV